MAAVTSLTDLEARVAALEADRADYRAVLAAVGALNGHVDELSGRVETVEIKTDANREAINALGEKLAGFQTETRTHFEALEQKSVHLDQKVDRRHDESIARFNSLDEQLAEIKDLVIDRSGGGRG